MVRITYIFILTLFICINNYGQHIAHVNVTSGIHQFYRPLKSNTVIELQEFFKLSDNFSFKHGIDNKFELYYDQYKVEDAGVMVNDRVVSGAVYDFELRDINPRVDPVSSFENIKDELDYNGGLYRQFDLGTPELLIHIREVGGEHTARIAYKLHARSKRIGYNSTVYIDAITGVLLEERNNLCHNDVAVFAKSLYQGNVILNVSRTDNNYTMEHSRLPIRTYDLEGRTQYPSSVLINGGIDLFVNNNSAVQAHYTAQQTYRYYLYRHNRDSYDGMGGMLDSYINYDNQYTNAFWDGDRMVYGAGDSVHYAPLISLDITGHELTHGVIDHSADLIYSKESGALNESFADIFGEMIEYFATGDNDWILGKETGLVDVLPFRSMIDPNSNDDPDTYGGIHWYNPECEDPRGSNDHCGVHNNSGVQNKWFYILAMGETGTNDLEDDYHVVGISRNAAATIAYRNLTTYLWPTSNFEDARNGSIQSARDLFGEGSIQEISTTNAWYAVGVGEPFEMPDTTSVPTYHIYPEVIDLTSNTILLSWFDDIPVDSLTYEVYLDSSRVTSTTDTSWQIESLDADRTYTIFVKAVKDDKVITKSATVNVLTLDDPIESNPIDTVLASYFEEGLDGWEPSGAYARWYVGRRSPEGSGSVQLRKDASNGSIESPDIFMDSNMDYLLEFSLYTWSMEINEKLVVEQLIDNEWIEIASYSSMIDFFNYNEVSLNVHVVPVEGATKIRFSIHASAMTDHVYIDEVILTAKQKEVTTFFSIDNSTSIWPNPCSAILNIDLPIVPDHITIVNINGATIINEVPNALSISIDLTGLNNGLYYVLIEKDGQIESQSFVKN